MPTVETNGIQTYYEEYGDGPPVIFLHGVFSDHGLWAEQMQPLTTDFRVIVYDLRGHGKTEHPDNEAYSIDYFVDDLADFIDALYLEQPIICGLSLGGGIGYLFATTYPEKLSGLITVGAGAPFELSTAEKVQSYLSDREWPWRVAQWFFEAIYGEQPKPDFDKIEAIRKSHSCEMLQQPADRHLGETALESARRSPPDFEAIEVPTLVMFGEYEQWTDSHRTYLQTKIPNVEILEIPGAYHNSQVDNPEFIREAIRRFLDNRVQPSEAEATI